MRRPLILSMFRWMLSGTIFIAQPCAYAQLQPAEMAKSVAPAKKSVVPANPSAPPPLEEMSAASLPDSPGSVLRRRMQVANDDTETASISHAGLEPDQSPDARTGSVKLTAAEAKASDRAASSGCSAERGTRNGIVELKSNGPEAARSTASPSAAIAAPSIRNSPACLPPQNPYQRFLNSSTPFPLTPRQKGYLAIHNFIDPGNIVTILGTSAIAVASDSHSAYGPGWRGFGKNAGISFVQDATGDFFGTFLIPSIAHEDPHYHRMPNASIPRRTLHAISRTVIAQSDDGHPIPNYSTLLTYPITAEIANLYVPGVATNGPSTVERILTGYGTDPIDNLITEFLPDVAKRIHVRVIFVQQIINQVAAGQAVNMFP